MVICWSNLFTQCEIQVKLGSQYYFYMETQTALAVPDEDNCITVYSSSQCPEFTHSTIARCLGIPESNVRVITRRVGGGFGGKAIKAISVSMKFGINILNNLLNVFHF
jgi:abscisic-aldehyde oxidase